MIHSSNTQTPVSKSESQLPLTQLRHSLTPARASPIHIQHRTFHAPASEPSSTPYLPLNVTHRTRRLRIASSPRHGRRTAIANTCLQRTNHERGLRKARQQQRQRPQRSRSSQRTPHHTTRPRTAPHRPTSQVAF